MLVPENCSEHKPWELCFSLLNSKFCYTTFYTGNEIASVKLNFS